MTEQLQAAPHSGFSVRTFAPAWGAAVMGSGALTVAVAVVGEGTAVEGFTTTVSRLMLLVVLAMLVSVVAVNLTRWIKHRDAALDDLHHPVVGGMSATLAGALLTTAVAMGKVGSGFLPDGLVIGTVIGLTLLGGLLALIIGWEFIGEILSSDGVPMPQISGTWFVPPVVTIVVPLALVPIIAEFPESAASLLAISWAMLGVGAILYLVITASLFMRMAMHPLPPAKLAPTLVIGMGPAGLIGLDVVRLAQAAEGVGAAEPGLVQVALLPATMSWGFGAWWLVSALVVLRRGYQSLPFSVSWWGFTFPFGAWTIATLVLGRTWDAQWMVWLGVAATVALVGLWLYVAARTVTGIRRGTIWAH